VLRKILDKKLLSTKNDFCEERRDIRKLHIVSKALTRKIKVSQRNWLTFFESQAAFATGPPPPVIGL